MRLAHRSTQVSSSSSYCARPAHNAQRTAHDLTLLLAGLLLLFTSTGAQAYTHAEVLRLQAAAFEAARARPARELPILQALRDVLVSEVLEKKAHRVDELSRLVEQPRTLAALRLLADEGLLPDADVGEDRLYREEDLLPGEPPPATLREKPLFLEGVVGEPIPYYVHVPEANYTILGGVLRRGSHVEARHTVGIAHARVFRAGGGAPVVVSRLQLETLISDGFDPVQAPEQVEERRVRGLVLRTATHGGARLRILRVPLSKWQVKPHVAPLFDEAIRQGEGVFDLAHLARRRRARAAVNGTFFIVAKNKPWNGKPLGPVILDGRLHWDYREPRVLAMRRAFVALLDDGTALIDETARSGEQILSSHRRHAFLRHRLKDRRIVHLLGGLGRLVREGDASSWREVAGRQFRFSYYSSYTRRPQTVLGVTPDGKTLYLVAQEGRPHSQSPMSLPELARYVRVNLGVWDAVFLDGGGSTGMVVGGRLVTGTEENRPAREVSTAILVH